MMKGTERKRGGINRRTIERKEKGGNNQRAILSCRDMSLNGEERGGEQQ